MKEFIFTLDGKERIPSEMISGYLLHSHLGDGAFGRTFLATQLKFPRTVVIKIPQSLGELSVIDFLHELHRTTQLKHPGIVTVYDTGSFEDPTHGHRERPYFTMEYLEGDTLENRFKEVRKTQSLNRNLALFISLCDAILYAQRLGVYHCDLHAQNILLQSVGSAHMVKIIDFGLPSKLSPTNVANREQADFRALGQLLKDYFFSPNINRLAENTIDSATSLTELLHQTEKILRLRFSDRLIFDDAGNVGVSTIDEREDRLGRVALAFVKEKVVAKDVMIRVQPFLGADVRWEEKGNVYEIAFYPATSTDAYGSFLMLLSLSQLHLNSIDDRVGKYVNSDSIPESVREPFDQFLFAYEILIMVNMLDESGFLYGAVKAGLRDFFHRQAAALLGPAPEARLVVYQGLLSRFNHEDVLKPLSKIESAEETELRKLWGFSYFISKLDQIIAPELVVMKQYCQAFIDCFFDKLYVLTLSDGKLGAIKADVLDVQTPHFAFSGMDDLLCLRISAGTEDPNAYEVQLSLQNLIDLYGCLIVEEQYRLPTSQVYQLGEVTLFGKYDLGMIVEIRGKPFHAKDKHDFFGIFSASIEQELMRRDVDSKIIVERIDRLISQLKTDLETIIISESEFADRDFRSEYMAAAVCLGKVVSFERRSDQFRRMIERLNKAQSDLMVAINQKFSTN